MTSLIQDVIYYYIIVYYTILVKYYVDFNKNK